MAMIARASLAAIIAPVDSSSRTTSQRKSPASPTGCLLYTSRPLGEVDEANLGRAYQLRVPVGEAGDFRWEVVLEDESTGAIIAVSEARAIIAMDG